MNTLLSLGKKLRILRQKRNEPLRIVASAVGIDSSLLSKIEHGERLPTVEQLEKMAQHFNIPFEELTAMAIAEKIMITYPIDTITLQALKIAESQINAYLGVNHDSTSNL